MSEAGSSRELRADDRSGRAHRLRRDARRGARAGRHRRGARAGARRFVDGDARPRRQREPPPAGPRRPGARSRPSDRCRILFDLHPHLGDAHVVRALRDFALGPRVPGASARPRLAGADTPDRDRPRHARCSTCRCPTRRRRAPLFDAELGRRPVALVPPRRLRPRGARPHADEIARAFRLAAELADARRGARARRRREARGAPAELHPRAHRRRRDARRRRRPRGAQGVAQGARAAFDEGARAFGLAEPRGMLVCGVQGCGKSLVSKAAARVLGLPLVRLDFADVFSTPSPEHAMREATRVTEAVAPARALGRRDREGARARGAADARQARVFGAFLTWLQERRSPVFVAATANEVDRLPPGARAPRALRRGVLRRPALAPRSGRTSSAST